MSVASDLIRDRAKMFKTVRLFFEERGVLEVDLPILGKAAPIDAHIDIMRVDLQGKQIGYLHSSPEYAMKRLLAQGIGDIYQMGHVFRDGEWGALHNPEFTMIEWYRLGVPLEHLIQETLDLICLFIPHKKITFLTYAEAFLKFAHIDLPSAHIKTFKTAAQNLRLSLPSDSDTWSQETWLDYFFAFVVEPNLQTLTVIYDYPPSHAALSQLKKKGDELVAERFEVYCQGIELANGFHELIDSEEQRHRLLQENLKRLALGKETLPIDEDFLQALNSLPDCCGVAVGFDRLMLLRNQKKQLSEILPLSNRLAIIAR